MRGGAAPQADVEHFLEYILENFSECYWLTTHCKHGVNNAYRALRECVSDELLDQVCARFQPTDWSVTKTDGIDFLHEFAWFDDNIFTYERQVLEEHHAIDDAFLVNPHNPQAIKAAEQYLRQRQAQLDVLNRFIEAHNQNYNVAKAELMAGQKRSHWMWYVFPQIQGLGKSTTAQFYAITNLAEAEHYLRHGTLREHLFELCQILLQLDITDPEQIFGQIDSLKLRSSMTLFHESLQSTAPRLPSDTNLGIFQAILNKFYNGEADPKTIQILYP